PRRSSDLADIGVNDGLNPVLGKPLGKIYGFYRADLGPAVGRDLTIFRIQAHDNMAGELAAGFCHKLRLLDRLSANNHVADPGIQIGLNRFEITNAATDLNWQFRKTTGNGPHNFAIDGLARESAIEIHQMQPPCAFVDPTLCHLDRVGGKRGGVIHTSLTQTDTKAILQINGWNNEHSVSSPLNQKALRACFTLLQKKAGREAHAGNQLDS